METIDFEHRSARAQATDVMDLLWGFAVRHRDFPLSEYHNRVVVTSAAAASEVLATAEDWLGGAGLDHRYVSASGPLGLPLIDDCIAAGYEHEVIVTMVYAGDPPEPAAHEVRSVSLDELRPALVRSWQPVIPNAADERVRQLVDRTTLYALGAEHTRLAIYDGDEVAAHADLFIDRAHRISQFENVVTDDAFRGRGYGTSLVRDALRRSLEAGSEISFLTADFDDWPRHWYQRLGYVEVGRTHHFARHAPD
jgi:GNAT superfamily N-acetyltransferase